MATETLNHEAGDSASRFGFTDQVAKYNIDTLMILLERTIQDENSLIDDVHHSVITGRVHCEEDAPQVAAMFSMIGRALEISENRTLIEDIVGELKQRLQTGVAA